MDKIWILPIEGCATTWSNCHNVLIFQLFFYVGFESLSLSMYGLLTFIVIPFDASIMCYAFFFVLFAYSCNHSSGRHIAILKGMVYFILLTLLFFNVERAMSNLPFSLNFIAQIIV